MTPTLIYSILFSSRFIFSWEITPLHRSVGSSSGRGSNRRTLNRKKIRWKGEKEEEEYRGRRCDVTTIIHFRRTAFSSQLKSKVGHILVKTPGLRIMLNIDGTPIASRSHTLPSHTQNSWILPSSLSLGVPVPHTTQCMRHLDPSVLDFSLSLYRHTYMYSLLVLTLSVVHNK